MAFLAVGNQAVRDLGQRGLCLRWKVDRRVAKALSVEQPQRWQGALGCQHGVYQNVAVTEVHDDGGIAQLCDLHGGSLIRLRVFLGLERRLQRVKAFEIAFFKGAHPCFGGGWRGIGCSIAKGWGGVILNPQL